MGLLEKIEKMAVCLVVEIWQNVEIYFWNIFGEVISEVETKIEVLFVTYFV